MLNKIFYFVTYFFASCFLLDKKQKCLNIMDELLDNFQNLIPVHDPIIEYENLLISKNLGIEKLANSSFLDQTFYRYKKYIKYIRLSSDLNYYILQFLEYEKTNYNRILLAQLCIDIDSKIINELEVKDLSDSEYIDSNSDEYMDSY